MGVECGCNDYCKEPPDEYENVSFGGGGGVQYTMEMDGGTCNGMDVWHLNKMDAEEEKEEKRF